MDNKRLFKLAGIEKPITETCGDAHSEEQEGTCGGAHSEEQESRDPIVQMAEIFERVVMQEGDQSTPEDFHEIASNVMNALHEELRNRGLMG